MRRDAYSPGEVISSFAYAGVGAWLGMAAAADGGGWLKDAVLAVCAAASFAGALRFRIAAVVGRVRGTAAGTEIA
jgi:hypothetical protein